MATEFPRLKDRFDKQMAQGLAQRIQAVHRDFDVDGFVLAVIDGLDTLELKDRVQKIADCLHQFLPDDYSQAIEVLCIMLGQGSPIFEGRDDDGFLLFPLPNVIETYGLHDFETSMQGMYIITRHASAEFAIRPFILQYPQEMLERLHEWVKDENEHVRRLVSEGTRPRLPWAPQLPHFIANPTPTLALLEQLKDDPSLYVRRSVANHLNDISKDHPERLLDLLEKWQDGASENRQWLINHALRTLIKAGNERALALLGYHPTSIELHNVTISPQILQFGDNLTIAFQLENTSDEPQNLMVDYRIHFVKANGKTAPKVFKLNKLTLKAGEKLDFVKKQSIRPISTRKYYAGLHRVEIQVNGQILGGVDFELVL